MRRNHITSSVLVLTYFFFYKKTFHSLSHFLNWITKSAICLVDIQYNDQCMKDFFDSVDYGLRSIVRGFPYTCSSDFFIYIIKGRFKNLFRLALRCPSDVFERNGVENWLNTPCTEKRPSRRMSCSPFRKKNNPRKKKKCCSLRSWCESSFPPGNVSPPHVFFAVRLCFLKLSWLLIQSHPWRTKLQEG